MTNGVCKCFATYYGMDCSVQAITLEPEMAHTFKTDSAD